MSKEEVVPTLFVREATGITRELGTGSAIAIGLSIAYGSGINWYSTWSSYNYPGANVAIGYLLPILTLMPTTLITLGFAICLPRSGGYYIWYSRFFHGGYAVMSQWTSIITPGMSSALLCWFVSSFLSLTIALYGNYTHNPGLMDFATYLKSNIPFRLAVTIGIILLMGLGNIFGMRVLKWLVNITVAYGLLGTFIQYILFAITPSSAVPAKWDAVWGAGAYKEVVDITNANGFQEWRAAAGTGINWNNTMRVLVPAEWGYSGYMTAVSSFAGETRNPSRNIPIATVGTLILVGSIYALLCALMYGTYGDFVTRLCYAHAKGLVDQFTIMSDVDPVTPTFSCSLTTNPIIQFIVSSATFIWLFNTALPGPSSSARYLFAVAFDRFAPEWFAEVNERFHSPMNAVIYYTLGTILFTFFAAYNVFIMIATTAITVGISSTVQALAAVELSLFKTDIYERGYVYSIGGIPWLAIVAVFALFRGLYKMGIAGMDIDMFSCYFIGTTWAIGLFIYILYCIYNKRRGIDVKKLFEEMPPE